MLLCVHLQTFPLQGFETDIALLNELLTIWGKNPTSERSSKIICHTSGKDTVTRIEVYRPICLFDISYRSSKSAKYKL